jgi:hypothetical protein
MAAVRIISGRSREVWSDAVPLDGGTSRTINTGIRIRGLGELCKVFGVLDVQMVAGAPVLTTLLTIGAGGYLLVTISNTAAAGNTATYALDVWWISSMQQGHDPTLPTGTIHIVTSEVGMGDSHQQGWVYPTVGAGGAGWVLGAQIVPNAAAGTFGVYADVIPAGWTTSSFTLIGLNVEVIMANLPVTDVTYEVVIATGGPGAEVERCRVRFTRDDQGPGASKNWIVNGLPLKTEMLAAGSRVRARVTTSAAGAPDLYVSVQGHYFA